MTDTSPIHSIKENLSNVNQAIGDACSLYKREREDVQLIAVSKFQSAEYVAEALEAGQRHFGENRVQEAEGKWPELRLHYPDVKLHLIGVLQTNKVKQAVVLFDVIEVVDRPKLVDAIVKILPNIEKKPECYIQVNIGDEEQKAGVSLGELSSLLDYCHSKQLSIHGLMCIPPADASPAPYFALLKKLADQHQLKHISMGMSGDYAEAIRQGSTAVRVGTAIFGKRD